MGLNLSLYLVAEPALCRAGLIPTVAAAVAAGVSAVQLRDKTATTAQRIETARALRGVLDGTGVPLIVNDDVEAALAALADGVHIGQSDGDPDAVRARIGRKILGLSVETVAQAARAPDSVDYLGAGPVFATATKPGHAAPVGIAGLAEIVAATRLPVVAIGGLAAAHTADVMATGAVGLAVVSAICAAVDPGAATAELCFQVRRHPLMHSST